MEFGIGVIVIQIQIIHFVNYFKSRYVQKTIYIQNKKYIKKLKLQSVATRVACKSDLR